jgi:hypothetical protein
MRLSWWELMPFLAGNDQVDRLKHLVKRHAGMLENRADLRGELLAALATLFEAVAESAFRVLLARLPRTPERS